MFDFLQNFEQSARQYDPIILLVPGIAVVLLGLFVWLGGLNFRKVLVAFVGASVGGVVGFLVSGRNLLAAIASAAVGALVAFVIERIFITLLSAILAAAVTITLLVNPNVKRAVNLKQLLMQLQPHYWLLAAAAAIILIIAGFFLWRLTSAWFYAILGTLLIFAGMILLLLYKGAMPISHITDNQPFYAAVFVAMTAFGTIVQLLFCDSGAKKVIIKKEIIQNKQN
ncbi:MAG: hypothetical protein ACYSSL_00495 [Planctomycetota bacterium]|jgi:hypothetical protein